MIYPARYCGEGRQKKGIFKNKFEAINACTGWRDGGIFWTETADERVCKHFL